MGAIKDYVKGVSTKGNCNECAHGATPEDGCKCKSAWCPCHAKAFGHRRGAHSCNC